MFLKNCWYVAGRSNEIGSGILTRQILGTPVLLFRTASGECTAMLDRCPHRLVPLSAGCRVGDAIQCGYHGMMFEADGRCSLIPGQTKIPANASATVFPTVERYNLLWIWMGDAEQADPELVPSLPWPSLDHWETVTGYTHVEADYRLLSDNLLDLSHENYIHSSTIGNDEEESIADFPPKTKVVDQSVVIVHRDMDNIIPPPVFRVMMNGEERINRWQTSLWTAPSVNMSDSGTRFVNAPVEETFLNRVLHLLTPETESSTHYFWSASRNFRKDEDDLTEAIGQAMARTFVEDKDMLELQQRNLEATGSSIPQFALKVDDAPLRARRILKSLIQKEQDGERGLIAPEQALLPDPEALQPCLLA